MSYFFNNCLDCWLSITILQKTNAQSTETVVTLNFHHSEVIAMEETWLNFTLFRHCPQHFNTPSPISIKINSLNPEDPVDASDADTLLIEKQNNIDVAWLQ